MFTSSLFSTPNLFTQNFLRRVARSAATLAMIVGLAAPTAFADGNYQPVNGDSNGWNSRPANSRSLGGYEVDRDSLPPHRGEGRIPFIIRANPCIASRDTASPVPP